MTDLRRFKDPCADAEDARDEAMAERDSALAALWEALAFIRASGKAQHRLAEINDFLATHHLPPSAGRVAAGLKLAEAADIACAPAESPFTFNRGEVGVFEFFEALKAYRAAVEAEKKES